MGTGAGGARWGIRRVAWRSGSLLISGLASALSPLPRSEPKRPALVGEGRPASDPAGAAGGVEAGDVPLDPRNEERRKHGRPPHPPGAVPCGGVNDRHNQRPKQHDQGQSSAEADPAEEAPGQRVRLPVLPDVADCGPQIRELGQHEKDEAGKQQKVIEAVHGGIKAAELAARPADWRWSSKWARKTPGPAKARLQHASDPARCERPHRALPCDSCGAAPCHRWKRMSSSSGVQCLQMFSEPVTAGFQTG